MKEYLGTVVNIVALITALGTFVFWAGDNLASKKDIDLAKRLSEFRFIELQLSLNDYRMSTLQEGISDPLVKEEYDDVKEVSKKLEEARQSLIDGGIFE